MKLILHAGAHCTDDDRIVKALLRNSGPFLDQGIAVPGPSRYRRLLTNTVKAMDARAPAPDARDVLLDTILDEDHEKVHRLILSHEGLLGKPGFAVKGAQFYRSAENRLAHLVRLFEGDQIELYFALRDPATFVPAAYIQSGGLMFAEYARSLDLANLRWSEFLSRLRATLPEIPITVWCNEDSPLVFGEVLKRMAGLPVTAKINGSFDILMQIMTREGMQRFREFLGQHPDLPEPQRRKAMMAFLEKYADDAEVEEELDLPGWTEELIDTLSALYDEDVETISHIPGVTLIEP
ncbi:hypothetical protein [Pseudaestuariivita atlantica]|uniref:Sulfotransferase domain-containing protein n=1 Tax=Pseudaestuariivita atlantica TaxID=1317121 RepID=A0A0L1JTC1_9RHOB|nr:hypothetical protein [Pseudaestuariivita atlantica]KNG95019.1 hypothetical protein ATO11_06570 [Pseudaestuariivita atlantica]